jgi:hypothetical protein
MRRPDPVKSTAARTGSARRERSKRAGRDRRRLAVHPRHRGPMKRVLIAILLSLPIFVSAPATAQSEDEAAVRAVVIRLFDGMRAGDGSGFGQLFTADARLLTAAVRRDGTPALTSLAVDSFAAMISQPRDFVLDERIDAWDVRVDGPLAIVTVDYSLYAGERFIHCGIDAFQLFKSAEGWKIFQLVDTRRTTGCPPQTQTESRP